MIIFQQGNSLFTMKINTRNPLAENQTSVNTNAISGMQIVVTIVAKYLLYKIKAME